MSFFAELKRRNVVRVGIAYTVAAWLLIQVSDTVIPRIGLPDSAVTLVIVLLTIGFIPALIFAWAFELTPDDIKREKDIDRVKSITPETGKSLNRLIITGLALVIVVMGVERLWFAGQEEAAESITNAKIAHPLLLETKQEFESLLNENPDNFPILRSLCFITGGLGEMARAMPEGDAGPTIYQVI